MANLFAAMRKILPVMLILFAANKGNAQTETTLTPPKAEHEHFFGLQLNELIRQFTTVDPTATTQQNPYLLTYATNSKRTNWGIRTGLGLQVGTSTGSNSNFGIDTTSKIFAVEWRGGVAWSHNITAKFISGVGFDLVFNYSKRETTQSSGGIGFADNIKTEITTYGAGPVASLRYQFTQRIALGTEASFYYTAGTDKSNVNGSPDNTSQKLSRGTFNLPVAIYFIIKI
jgi:hypothetical protein